MKTFRARALVGPSKLIAWASAAAMVALTGSVQAELFDRGGGMIYDSTRNITWLADMNYAQTSGHDADGLLNWSDATDWAENLTFGGYSDWRLPTLNPADTSCTGGFGVGYGFNCTGGELSGLFVTDLGNKGGESVLNQESDTAEQIANLALFSNVRSSHYWSGTEFDPSYAWNFRASDGLQSYGGKTGTLYAVAVRPGDVAAVPEPETYGLLLAGLGLVLVAVRKQSH